MDFLREKNMYNFSEITGNEQIIKSMKSAIKNSMVSHAYIINGPEGCGKKLLASAFAKTLFCEEGGTDACGHCTSCKTFENGNNPDMIYVYPTKTKALSVDDVRQQITSTVNIKPYNHKYKIYMIPNADTLTVAAQNSLLKTLEEPPEYVVFLLLAKNMNQFLETILSRCVTFGIKPISLDKVKNYLITNGIADESSAGILAEYSQGSIGEAIKFAQSESFGELRKKISDILKDISRLSYFELTQQAKALEEFKDLTDITDMIFIWYRDVLVYKTTGNESNIIEKDLIAAIKNEAERASFEGLYKIPNIIMETKKQIRQNVNFVFAFEMLFINIKGELTA